jgi:PPOX class probable F420-dependent enzyme
MRARDQVALDPAGVVALLAGNAKMQLATINPDGSPHLVAMFYALRDDRIAFWTYRSSQKARNLARDPRLTCLVEDGEQYFELRGVQIAGVAEPVEAPADVAAIGRLIAARMPGIGGTGLAGDGLPGDGLPGDDGVLSDYVAQAAAKRVAYLVRPRRVSSWDHRRLLT